MSKPDDKKDNSLDWMYNKDTSEATRDDYLLGRKKINEAFFSKKQETEEKDRLEFRTTSNTEVKKPTGLSAKREDPMYSLGEAQLERLREVVQRKLRERKEKIREKERKKRMGSRERRKRGRSYDDYFDDERSRIHKKRKLDHESPGERYREEERGRREEYNNRRPPRRDNRRDRESDRRHRRNDYDDDDRDPRNRRDDREYHRGRDRNRREEEEDRSYRKRRNYDRDYRRRRSYERPREEEIKNGGYRKNERRSGDLSEDEKRRRLAEMMQDGAVHQEMRQERIKKRMRAKHKLEEEEEQQRGDGSLALSGIKKKAYLGDNMTLESRLNSRKAYREKDF